MTDMREPDPAQEEGKTTMRQRLAKPATGLTLSTCFLIVAGFLIWRQLPVLAEPGTYRGLLGENNKKVRLENGRTLIWAAGDPDSPEAEWYDFTDAPIPTAELQFGIGKDRIPSIDEPEFVSYRQLSSVETRITDQTDVIGYVAEGIAKAYPLFILDRHEIVNDTFAGTPYAVYW